MVCQTREESQPTKDGGAAAVVQGVGNGVQTADYEVTLTCVLKDTDGRLYEESYTAPCLEGSRLPGLIGIQTLSRNDALIRCRTGELWYLGPGGAEIKPSPGSRHFQMRKAKTGHWMLPVGHYGEKAQSYGTNLHTEAAASSPPVQSSDSSSSKKVTFDPAS